MAEQQPLLGAQKPRAQQFVRGVITGSASGSFLFLSGLTLTGTVVALCIATPFFVIFSPVLVPAVITTGLIVNGFLASGGFAFGAILVFTWLFRYLTGRQPLGAQSIDQARLKLAGKAKEMKERAEQFGQQATGQQSS